MIQDIITGIAVKLDTKYGYPVAQDTTEQGLNGPYFYIKQLISNEDPLLGTRYMRRYSLDVHYFPASDNEPSAEINAVIETLYDLLEYVNMGTDLVRSKGMRHDVQSDVMHFFVNYDLVITKKAEPEDAMESVNIIQEVV